MRSLLKIAEWFLDIKRFVVNMDGTAFIVIICLLAILLMAMMKYVIKHGVNVYPIKKNIVKPLVFSILVIALIIILLSLRSI